MINKFTATPEMFTQPVICQVDEEISPDRTGRVKYQGTFWKAQFYRAGGQRTVKPGEWVKVVGRQGIRLLVGAIDGVQACA
jgi:membrane protein implicated in regulation of membrane protease activity